MKKFLLFSLAVCCVSVVAAHEKPLRVAIAGLTHGHVEQVLRERGFPPGNFEIIGIWETNGPLETALTKKYGIDPGLVYADLERMLDAVKPEAVAGYGNIFDHLKIVEAAAPRHIHVMVEKPLAVSAGHARRIAALARKHGIIVMTNYETTWYPANNQAREAIDEGRLGPLRKVIVYDGHNGPIGINVQPTFLEWLADPKLNGGGAVIDFGCYGANLITWLMRGERPVKVYADVRTHDPASYPNVDDDATILLSYRDMECVVNGSWAWPFSRKDMHIYGRDGYFFIHSGERWSYRYREMKEEATGQIISCFPMEGYNVALGYLARWIRGEITPQPYDLSALENNVLVVEILNAARRSAQTSRAVRLK
ncbi:MAG: Gfo/Idh/MocA family oxidoreductase [Rikenellaceae bacterium]|jgi:predicted dehydrogenase|nr:Gfo/Idh/MocA family oxidoreductase [Rikenellaceae bacterium]